MVLVYLLLIAYNHLCIIYFYSSHIVKTHEYEYDVVLGWSKLEKKDVTTTRKTRMKSLTFHGLLLEIKYVSLIFVFNFDFVCYGS